MAVQMPWGVRNFTIHVDGAGFAGRVTKVKLPDISVKKEEHRASGMDSPRQLDHGLEALELTFNSAEFSRILRSKVGILNDAGTAFVIRGTLQNDDNQGESSPVVATCKGAINKVESSELEPGTKTDDTYTVDLKYYKLEIGGEKACEIDIDNYIRFIGNTDQLASMRGDLLL